ncbi:MAG: 3-deoxy-7-phosphoheptulonate synthase [Gemmatimonadales bacterium]
MTAFSAQLPQTVPVTVADRCCFGGSDLIVIGGPCSVESAAMVLDTALSVAASGARMLRGGAFKPRTSPHTFQGLGDPALDLLALAGERAGLPVVTEVTDPRHVERVAQVADMLQVGARNMQNYALLAEVGRSGKPVLLKRGLAATLKEFLLAAEHVRVAGNDAIVLCERGIRTFETSSRFTLDVTAVPVLKSESHLPVIVDPSHAGGRADLVAPLARAAIAAGADGLIVEVHPDPTTAQSDAEQSLTFAEFAELMGQVERVALAVGRTIGTMPVAIEATV